MIQHLLPPSVSDNYYCLEDLLGEGSFGKVYRGHTLSAPEVSVAIKLPKMELKLSGILEGYRRTMREAALLQKTSSPQVVRCFDYSRDSSFPYVVMEYVPHTLATLSPTPQIVEDIVIQLPEIITALHDAQIAHCDLRENNIGYVDGTLKLLDFGLAIPFQQSVLYMERQVQESLPPEFRRGNIVTKTTDTYSAGRVLERLLTGEYSASPAKAIAKMKEIYGQEPPRSFQRLLRRMLRPDHFFRPNPMELRILAQTALQDLQKNNPFTFEAMVPLADAGIDFGISSSS